MISSGQGEIPYRRYSPRTAMAGDSETDSIVWMGEEAGVRECTA